MQPATFGVNALPPPPLTHAGSFPMFSVLTCLTVQHDLRLVLLAGVVCFVACVAAIGLFGQASCFGGSRRIAWLATAGVAGGCGVWATHFIAILAYRPGVPVTFDALLTSLSLLLSIIALALGFGVAALGRSRWRLLASGVVIGGGVGLMHFVGMWALLLPGRIEWSTEIVLASLIWGCGLACAAISIASRAATTRHLLGSALLLTFAIAGLHFIAMAAVRIVADPARQIDVLAYSSGAMAFGVASATIAVLALGLLGALTDRRVTRQAAAFDAEIGEIKALAANDAQTILDRLRDAIDALPEGLALFDAEDRYVLWNGRYAEIYELGDDLRQGGRFEDTVRSILARGLYHRVGRDDEAWLQSRLARHRARESVVEQQMSDGRWIQIAERRTSEGGTVAVHVDITELKRREASFQLLLENNPIPIWVYDTETLGMLAVNDAAVEHYKYSREQFLSMTMLDIRPEEDRAKFIEVVKERDDAAHRGMTWRHIKADGEIIEVAIYSRPLQYEGRDARIVAVFDITERKKIEDRIVYLAHHDVLTGLPNRAAFAERLAAAIAEADAKGSLVGVLCLDLDRFKEVNDVFGHSVGDELLRRVADKLRAAAADAEIARVGGDEFTVVVSGGALLERVADTAERLRLAVADPFEIGGRHVRIGLSIGGAIYPNHGDMTTLLANADAALYRAKTEGGGRACFFDSDLDSRLRERHALLQDLRHAIERGELLLHYQPQARENGDIFGFEALARWLHPSRGFVPPDVFIPIAEEGGLVAEIGEWVLREACREAASWPNPLCVAVNLSPIQFRNDGLPQLVHAVLLETGLPAQRLELEITEGVLVDDFSRVTTILRQLKCLGVKIAMDDFGTGYSSLSYLQSFPFDKIKIDRSFVSSLRSNKSSEAIIRAIIGLGRGLGVPLIAEGVETQDQLEFLVSAGCCEAQGYLIGRPGPIQDYAAIVWPMRRLASPEIHLRRPAGDTLHTRGESHHCP